MNTQNLSLPELKICALLYSIPNTALFDTTTFLWMSDTEFNTFRPMQLRGDTFKGTWYERPFCTTPGSIIDSLIAQGLIIAQEKHKHTFYVLNIQEEKFKEFFKELDIQIALGSV